jgi:hypothetical protein
VIKLADANIFRFSVSSLRLHTDDGPLVSEFIVSHHCGK